MLTIAPTVRQSSQTLLLSIACSISKFEILLNEVSQAYVQLEDSLERDIIAALSKFFNYPPEPLFKIARVLYGVSEAGI